jgi:hypothetical protein
MNTPVELASFALGLVAVFGAGLGVGLGVGAGVGAVVGPVDSAPAAGGHANRGEHVEAPETEHGHDD